VPTYLIKATGNPSELGETIRSSGGKKTTGDHWKMYSDETGAEDGIKTALETRAKELKITTTITVTDVTETAEKIESITDKKSND